MKHFLYHYQCHLTNTANTFRVAELIEAGRY